MSRFTSFAYMPDNGEKAVGCPYCKAGPGQPCRSRTRGEVYKGFHAARWDAAKAKRDGSTGGEGNG